MSGRAGLVALALTLCISSPARAEVDWPLGAHLPEHDIALGVTGGMAFGEDHRRGNMGALAGLDVSYLHGVFGAHLSLTTFRERTGIRLQPLGEITLWYLALFGVGASIAPMLGDIPRDVPETATALHGLVGIPIPVWRPGTPEEPGGAFLLVPFARPGLRLGPRGAITGHHTVGLMLKWTTFTP